jgi:hypothetical protein
MKSSNVLAALIATTIFGSISPTAHAQSLNILQSQNNTFTFSQCVSDICVQQMKLFQESVEEYIPEQIAWGGGGSSGVGRFGGSKIPARWDRYDRARLTANVSFPSCPNQYHLEGSLTLYYRNGSSYITRSYQIQRSDENQNRDLGWTVRGYFGNPSNGTASIEGSSTCVYHGVNDRGGSPWDIWNW